MYFSLTILRESSKWEEQSMKTETNAFAGQRKTICHMEREIDRGQTQTLNYFFSLVLQLQRACLLVLWSPLRVWWKTPFWSSTQNGGRNFRLSLHRLWVVFNSRLYVITSPSQLTFKHESLSLTSTSGVGGKNGSVSGSSTPAQKMWYSRFFLVSFNYRCYSPVTGLSTTSALTWLTQGSTDRSVCFFLRLFFFSFFFLRN